MKYKGAIVKNSIGKLYAFVQKDDGDYSDGFPITGFYDQMELTQLYCVYIEFFDGTMPVNYEYAMNRNLEDIFLKVEDLQIISFNENDNGIEDTPIHKIVEDGNFRMILSEIFNDSDIYYQ